MAATLTPMLNAMLAEKPKPLQCVSAVPGRLRYKVSPHSMRNGTLRQFAEEIASLPGVIQANAVHDANSVVVRYSYLHRELDDVIREVEEIAARLIGGDESEGRAAAVNGAMPNGTVPNGAARNGASTNGASTNGARLNGANGTASHGPAANGTQNGAAHHAPAANGAAGLTRRGGRLEPSVLLHELKVQHAIPGRLRLKVPHIRRKAHVAAHLQHSLSSENGIHSVEHQGGTDSLVVKYDHRIHHPVSIQTLVHELLLRALENPAVPPEKATGKDMLSEEERQLNPLIMPTVAIGLAATGLAPAAVTVGAISLAASPIVRDAIQGAKERRFNVAQLDLAALSVLTMLGDYLTGGIMTWLIGLGDWIRLKTMRTTKRAISDLMSPAGQQAWVEQDGVVVSVPVDRLEKGDIVIVYPGDQIPVDGVVVDGKALVDQKVLTGESHPVNKEVGDPVFALTIVADGQIRVQVEHVGNETRAGQVVRMIEDAPLSDTRISNYAAMVGDRLAGPIFALAGVVYAVTLDPVRTAAVLILDFCTGIRVSAPTTILSAMAGAAKQGLFIKGGKAMEKLAVVDAVIFDKTGTLTRGEPFVTMVHTFDGDLSTDEVLRLAASAEANLKHPAAKAIVEAAEARGLEVTPVSEMEYALGMGVQTVVDDQTLYVGSDRYMRHLGIDATMAADLAAKYYELGNSLVYIARERTPGEKELIGLLTYCDPPREEAKEVIKALLARKVKRIVMLTGDNRRAAQAVASTLGITDVVAEAFPEQKAEVVEKFRAEGYTVAVLGDGINDSPAFTRADVGISLPHGADVAKETADVILLDGDLRGLPRAIDLARGAMGILRQNVNIILWPTAVGMVGAAFGVTGPMISTLINNGTTVITGVNALRPLMVPGEKAQAALPAPAEAGRLTPETA